MEQGFEAIKNEDIATLSQLISSGQVDINERHDMRGTFLSNSMFHQKRSIFEFLIEANADVNRTAFVKSLLKPLHFAAHMEDSFFLETLISQKADVNAKNWQGMTPLTDAVIFDLFENCKILVEAGSNIKETPYNYWTSPIGKAVQHGQRHIFTYLLDKGAHFPVPVSRPPDSWAWAYQLRSQRCRVKRTIVAVVGCFRRRLGVGRDMAHLMGHILWGERDEWE